MKVKSTIMAMPAKEQEVTHDNFKDAFKRIFDYVKANINGMSYQELETCLWIEVTPGIPMYFYQSRDMAYQMGIMKDGKFVS